MLSKRSRRRGQPVEGAVAHCHDPNLVRFPGTYATKQTRKGEVPDRKAPVRWVTDVSVDGNGYWVYD